MLFSTKRYKITLYLALFISFTLAIILPVSIWIFFLLNSHINFWYYLGISSFTIFYLSYVFCMRKYKKRKKILTQKFPAIWEEILSKNVLYYNSLSQDIQIRFKQMVQIFLAEKQITPIDTDIDEKCKVLTAASAIIPIFSYPEWEYDNLNEILIYPQNFDKNYAFNDKNSNILGLVDGKTTMILSKPALLNAFNNTDDKQNVGIHEFIHKIDGADGAIDGMPALLLNKKQAVIWNKLVEKESALINAGDSDINPYALTNHAEFFSVASEYFFENPTAMYNKHRELYNILAQIFNQDTKSLFTAVVKSIFKIKTKSKKFSRNSPCPCGSGKKYKKCCLGKK